MMKWIISLWYNFFVECLLILDEVYISYFICGLFLKTFSVFSTSRLLSAILLLDFDNVYTSLSSCQDRGRHF